MSRRWREVVVVLALGWLLWTPMTAQSQLLPFAWRLRPKWLFRYGYRWGLDPYVQRYYDPYRKNFYFGGFYEYYGTDYAERLGQTMQATEDPALPETAPQQPEAVPVIYTDPASPPTPAPPPAANRAHVVVRVPVADAEVWFGGHTTGLKGLERSFHSPPLATGRDYTYDVRVRWRQDGQEKDDTRSIQVQPGQEVLIDFNSPP